MLQKFSISDTNYIQWYGPKGRERDSGGPEEIMPPPLMPRSVSDSEGGLSRGSGSDLTQKSGIRVMMIPAASQSSLKCKRINFSVTWFPISENDTNTSRICWE